MIESTINSDIMNVDENIRMRNDSIIYFAYKRPLVLPKKHHEEAGLICFPKKMEKQQQTKQ